MKNHDQLAIDDHDMMGRFMCSLELPTYQAFTKYQYWDFLLAFSRVLYQEEFEMERLKLKKEKLRNEHFDSINSSRLEGIIYAELEWNEE